MVALIFIQLPLDHHDRRRLVLGLATVRDRLVLAVPRRQNEPPGYRHDDHDVIQAHVRHVHQIHRQNLIPDLIKTKYTPC